MATNSAFARARQYAKQHGASTVGTFLTGLLTTVALVFLLVDVAAIAALLASGGSVVVPTAQLDRVQAIAGSPDTVDEQFARYENPGVLSLWVGMQDRPAGSAVARLYRRIPALRSNRSALAALVAAGLFFAAWFCVSRYLVLRSVRQLGERLAARFRYDIYRQAMRLGTDGPDPMDRTAVGDLMGSRTRAVRDGLEARWFDLTYLTVVLVAMAAVALLVGTRIALLGITAAVVIAFFVARATRGWRRKQDLLDDRADRQTTELVDTLAHIPLAQSYLLDETPGEPLSDLLRRHHHDEVAKRLNQAGIQPRVQFLAIAASLVLLGLIGWEVLNPAGGMHVFDAVLLLASMTLAIGPAVWIVRVRARSREAERAARSIFSYLDRESRIGETTDAQPLAPFETGIEFESVRVKDRTGRTILNDLSFNIAAGERVALVGTNRRALRAVASLLVRFVDPDEGKVRIDGHDVRRATLESLRGQIALVLHDHLVFTASVRENIRCSNPRFSDRRVLKAAQAVHADQFLQHLPDGLDTVVGEHGIRLEPSRAFRVGLARALLHDPRLVVVEEPLDELDPQSEDLVDHALRRIARGRTLVIIPNRLQWLHHVDRVIVLRESEFHASGPHDELLEKSELYRHMQYVRFNAFRDVAID